MNQLDVGAPDVQYAQEEREDRGTAWMKTKEPSQVDSGDSTKNNNDGDVPQV